MWLLIGVLLGTGGTLLTSSFWLPAMDERQVAAPEDGGGASSRSNRGAAASVLPTAGTAGDGNGDDAPATSAADVPPGPAEPSADLSAGRDVVDRPLLAGSAPDRPAPDVDTETSQPPTKHDDAAVDREVASLPALPPAPENALSSEEALSAVEALAAEEALTALASRGEVTQPTADQPGRSGPDRTTVAGPPSLDDASGITSIIAAAGNGPASAPAAATAPNAAQDELSPRIMQALRGAGGQATSAATSPGGRLYRVQLAAVDDEAAAQVFWREVNQRLPGVFADVEPIFDRRVVDQRRFLRVWVGGFDNRPDAVDYCGWLKKRGQDCFVTRVDKL